MIDLSSQSFLGFPVSAYDVQGVFAIFFFEGFCFLIDFNLQVGGGVVVIGFEGVFQLGAEGFACFGVFDEFVFLIKDRGPPFFVQVVFTGEFFEAFDQGFGGRDDAVDEFVLPAVYDGGYEGVYNGCIQGTACFNDCHFVGVCFHGLHVFPDSSRRFTEGCISFFLGEVFEYVVFAAIGSSFFQVVCFFSRFLGKFGQKVCRCLAGGDSVGDAVKGGEEEAGGCQVGVGEGVRSTEFESGGFRIVNVSYQADEDGSVTGRNFRFVFTLNI